MVTTIHDDIEPWLAAALHDELGAEERAAFDQHLAECPSCRTTFEEGTIMSNAIADTLHDERPDAAFEQRALASFRNRVPARGGGIVPFFAGLMQLRATQITAVAALLLALTQIGRLLTNDEPMPRQRAGLVRERAEENAAAAGSAQSARKTAPTGSVKKPSVDSLDASINQSSAGPAAPQQSRAQTKPAKDKGMAETERTVVTGSRIAPSEELREEQSTPPSAPIDANRKLVRSASAELEVQGFDEATQKITTFAGEDGGYVATTSSQKQENGKLRGEVVVKVLPEHLDRFLGKLRGLGELKNQTLGTEDITKQYFDTDSRLKNAHAMEQRLVEILKKKSEDISDLLQVEKEIGRVREQIEQMQGALKYMDAQVQFATVTITLAEKDMNVPAAFLLKERAQLALFAPEVEKTYNEIKALASPKVQITNAQLDRDNTGRVSAQVSILIAPEESDGVINRVKDRGRVENFQVQTERVAKGGEGMSQEARTERDKVELNITISREEQEVALQQTSLRIRTSEVNDRTKQLRELADKQSGRVRSSSFSRDPDGREFANVALRVPMKNYAALMRTLNSLGKVENVSVHRDDRPNGQVDEANAPADVSIQVYSQGNIVSEQTGIIATLRRTIGQGAAALMYSVRMIGVALAFFAPWVIALAVLIWILKIVRRRRARKE